MSITFETFSHFLTKFWNSIPPYVSPILFVIFVAFCSVGFCVFQFKDMKYPEKNLPAIINFAILGVPILIFSLIALPLMIYQNYF